MAVSTSSWKELRSVLDSDKKLLKKPNLPLMANQLNSLSLRMQDEELPRHAAVCHVEEAHLYQKMGNPNEERKQYATAASMLNNTIPTDMMNRSRGLTSLEAAKALVGCNQYEMAQEHAQRAVRLLEGEFYTYTRAVYLLAEIHFYLSEWEHLLADIDDLWMSVMKTRPKSVAGRRILKDLEVMTVLILQKSQVPRSLVAESYVTFSKDTIPLQYQH
ncbi:unnamed protein product [Strongylus vulgaris]|uniref:Uncharacterized protein n=1 Tax=Strongylus vulgaris TaxID=40348 RepID=A0A3P7L5H8_STRVU|nr:unnamed protein product [Strongylus vulgaris]